RLALGSWLIPELLLLLLLQRLVAELLLRLAATGRRLIAELLLLLLLVGWCLLAVLLGLAFASRLISELLLFVLLRLVCELLLRLAAAGRRVGAELLLLLLVGWCLLAELLGLARACGLIADLRLTATRGRLIAKLLLLLLVGRLLAELLLLAPLPLWGLTLLTGLLLTLLSLRLVLLAALGRLLAFLLGIVRVGPLRDHERAVPHGLLGARVGHGAPVWNRERGQQRAGEQNVTESLQGLDGIGERIGQ